MWNMLSGWCERRIGDSGDNRYNYNNASQGYFSVPQNGELGDREKEKYNYEECWSNFLHVRP